MTSVESLLNYGLRSDYVELLKRRGITSLNQLQKKAIDSGALDDVNALIVAPTASGKTLIGEIALVKNIYRGFKSVYLVPLRALASEIYSELKALESIGVEVGISTGDYESPAEHLKRHDLIVATYERFDSLLRLKPSWIDRVRSVVIDEFHSVNDPDRGPTVEMIVARLMSRGVKVVGLSATIGNSRELAEWMNAVLVVDTWRPVELVEGYYDSRSKSIVLANSKVERVEVEASLPPLNIALQSYLENIQTLVFVHNRKRAEELAEELVSRLGLYRHSSKLSGVEELLAMLSESPSRMERDRLSELIKHGVAYHHAGLSAVARRVVERGFRNRLIKVLFATPTLAAGVNLPARRVLVSVKRYDPTISRSRRISVFEYKQMAGRAGRPRYDPVGEAIIYDADPEESMRYIKGSPEPVVSKLGSARGLRIHVLSLIASGEARRFDEIIDMLKRTLYYTSTGSVRHISEAVREVVEDLVSWNMVVETGGSLEPTRLGRTTSITYLDPLSVHRYLEELVERPKTIYYLHKIVSTPDYVRSRPYISVEVVEGYEREAINRARAGEISMPPDSEHEYEYYEWLTSYAHAIALHDWISEVEDDAILQRYDIGPGDLYAMRETAAWISSALSSVERVLGNVARSRDLAILSERLEHGVREDALELVKLEGIGRVRARVLISHGIDTLEKLAAAPSRYLEALPSFGPALVRKIREQLREMGYSLSSTS